MRSDTAGAKLLVLDANILVRAALGRRVLPLLTNYAEKVTFLAPEVAFADARAYVAPLLVQRGMLPATADAATDEIFERLHELVISVSPSAYVEFEAEARLRLRRRDESDWPFVALALSLNCPIRTEDQDFFGSGLPIWTTDRVEIYLSAD
jgi:predicted nucleic acid-binding protein